MQNEKANEPYVATEEKEVGIGWTFGYVIASNNLGAILLRFGREM
jgi:UPF0716 family protein affecting phage T7 exclusion